MRINEGCTNPDCFPVIYYIVIPLLRLISYIVAPTITAPMDGLQFNITEGSNGSITCTATGYPVPTVVWLNSDGSSLSNSRLVSGRPVNISSTGVGNVTSVSVELMVIGAMRVDTGMYRCSANNILNATAVNISITMQCKYLLYVNCKSLIIHAALTVFMYMSKINRIILKPIIYLKASV